MDAGPDEAQQLHDTLEFIGLRAHATTVGLLQLCSELVRAGVIDLEAVERIKNAIHQEITLAHRRGHGREEFAMTLKQRLDAIFPHGEQGDRGAAIGDVRELKTALDPKG
ncbi:hypothetical protein E2493_01480 [Sphingomonas parva]|uniref:Uncharacterized protein n=1 Tax=Sphingomonas parva TaxID=2555898 RepID=A0A4Y8ZYC6_9SPHN|nr:hypothetical protein [Sphingomonas parva]TFI59949.1 hypothetical protein E2493_01480 [Sphingomonas parva]